MPPICVTYQRIPMTEVGTLGFSPDVIFDEVAAEAVPLLATARPTTQVAPMISFFHAAPRRT